MRFKVKDIGEDGLDVRLAVTDAWLTAECPDLDARPAPQGIALEGRIERNDDTFLLRGRLRGALLTVCGRCLDPAVLPLDVPIAVTYAEAEDNEDPEDSPDASAGDVLPFQDGVIDLTGEIRDEILLALPMAPLCRADCRGICSVCGGNRNSAPCNCEEQQRLATSKLSALKNVKV